LSLGASKLSDLIHELDGGSYSHAAIWSGEQVIEATLPRVHEITLQQASEKAQYVDAFRYRDAGAPSGESVVGSAREYLGRPYSEEGLLLSSATYALTSRLRDPDQQLRALFSIEQLAAVVELLRKIRRELGEVKERVTCVELAVRAHIDAKLPVEVQLRAHPPFSRELFLQSLEELWKLRKERLRDTEPAHPVDAPEHAAGPDLAWRDDPVARLMSTPAPREIGPEADAAWITLTEWARTELADGLDLEISAGPIRDRLLVGRDWSAWLVTPHQLETSPSLRFVCRLPAATRKPVHHASKSAVPVLVEPARVGGDVFYGALDAALEGLQVEQVQRLCLDLAHAIQYDPGQLHLDERWIAGVLKRLRQERFLPELDKVARAYLSRIAGPEPPWVRLQMLQAQIEQGQLTQAEDELMDLVSSSEATTAVGREGWGLLGRVYKQGYMQARRRTLSAARRLGRAVRCYSEAYFCAPEECWWHGINVVACLARAERDGWDRSALSLADAKLDALDWRALARAILERVETYDVDAEAYTWATATALEASIAIEDARSAGRWCGRYLVAPNADRFELASTIRQLREVWQLEERDAPGVGTLERMSDRLIQLGAVVALPSRPLPEQRAVQRRPSDAVPLRLLDRLSQLARSVAKLYKDTDEAVSGTGFLVRGRVFTRQAGDARLFLITNHHVVNPRGIGPGLLPERTRVRFTRWNEAKEFGLRVVWAAPEHDTTICRVDGLPDDCDAELGIPIGRVSELDRSPTGARSPGSRCYVMGHPQGHDLRVTLFDNQLIEVAERECRLRYRSPTGAGSSGSPVLTHDLNVIAVHRAADASRSFNEGVLLPGVVEQIAGKLASA
jgi:hypothetical protein